MAVSTSLNILIVDDSSAQQNAVKQLLKDTGFTNITCAAGPKEAIKIIAENAELQRPIELLICNDGAIDEDGVQLYSHIKGSQTPNLPFLLLCQNSEKDKIMGAVQAGIRNILLRPFSKQSFINELSKLLG